MLRAEYIQAIDNAKQRAIDAIVGRQAQLSRSAYDLLVQAIEDVFKVQKGRIVVESTFTDDLNQVVNSFVQSVKANPSFQGAVGSYLKSIKNIGAKMDDFYKVQAGYSVPGGIITDANTMVVNEAVDQLLEGGLNTNFAAPLRDLMYQNITAGSSLNDLKQRLNDYIDSGADKSGKLQKYLEQTALQGVDAYEGVINMKLLERFGKEQDLLMVGSLIKTSSPQCIYVVEELGNYITKDDWPELEDMATDNGLVEGTTFENLPLLRLHWGCRHAFYPVTRTES